MIELNKVYNMDCLEGMRILQDESIDCVICDLPYYKVVKNGFDNQWKTLDDYLNWVNDCIRCVKDKLKDGGNLLLFCSRQNVWRISQLLDENGFIENRTIIWARKRGFNTTRGHELASGYEPILFWSKGKSNTFNNIKLKVDSKRKEYNTGTLKDGITMSDVWTDISALPHNSKERVEHPTQKPVKLIERLVSLFSNDCDVVLDFCMGSGTTAIACIRTGRNFIGFETDENYYKIIQKRIDEEKGGLF